MAVASKQVLRSTRRLRRIVLPILIVALVAPANVAAQTVSGYTSEVLADSPVAYWRLGESSGTVATDATGNHSGSYVGSPSLGADGALQSDTDSAVAFDGVDDEVRIAGFKGITGSDARSVEFFLRTDDAETSILQWGGSGTGGKYHLRLSAGRLRLTVGNGSRTATATVADNEWHHVVVTMPAGGNLSDTTFYVDGASNPASGSGSVDTVSGSDLTLGRAPLDGRYLTGTLDEVAIYDHALSAERVTAHHEARTGAAPDPGSSIPPLPTPSPLPTIGPLPSPSPGPLPSPTIPPVEVPDLGELLPEESPDPTAPRIVAVGDIACDPGHPEFNNTQGTGRDCHMRQTSDLALAGGYQKAFVLGDLQYVNGTYEKFQASYDPTWGRLKSITAPVVGNHEYLDGDASGYKRYFGLQAMPNGNTWYSLDIGTWHVVVLDSNCNKVGGCGPDSAQGRWLEADLAASTARCTLAAFHHPRFSSEDEAMPAHALWKTLYANDVDLILNGHKHSYERFAPMDPSGDLDQERGITQITVGTGGIEAEDPTDFKHIWPTSRARMAGVFGVLELSLLVDGFTFNFVPDTTSGTYSDSGSGVCH